MLLGSREGYLDQQHYLDQVLPSLTLAMHRLDCEQLRMQVGRGFYGCVCWKPSIDMLNSDQSIVGDFGFKGNGPEVFPRVILPSRPPPHFIK